MGKRQEEEMNKLGIISLGFFLVLLGLVWILTPDIGEHLRAFLSQENWRISKVGQRLFFPEPNTHYPVLYNTASYFCFAFGAFQIVILLLRVVLHNPLNKIGETLSEAIFWMGMSFFFGMLASNALGWFGLFAGFLMLVGASIITKSIFRLMVS
ncbi:MAG: hypothetical protein QXT73_02620 [Candidatus Methanomethylicaceae archaeon]